MTYKSAMFWAARFLLVLEIIPEGKGPDRLMFLKLKAVNFWDLSLFTDAQYLFLKIQKRRPDKT